MMQRYGVWRAWFAVLVLCLAQIVSTVDRGMLALVIDPVRADLGISDVQIAMLQGFAFAVFYVSVGIPLGFVADAVNRRLLLVAGIVVWSTATLASGLADSFGHMFAARLFIGVGEAVLGPCAVGMIGELFPSEKRGRPMALYVLGSMIAYGIGSAATGYILEAVPAGFFAPLALLDGLAPWRVAFIVIGAAGFPVALLLMLLRDPARGPDEAPREPWSARATLIALWQGRGVYLPLYGAVALFAVGASVASGWSAVMLTRLFGIDPASAGKSLGFAQIVWAAAGALIASVLIDRVGRRAGSAGKIVLAGVLSLATIPSCLGAYAPGPGLAAGLGAEVMFTSALFGTAMLSVIADIVPPRSRGVAVALYAFVMTMIGGSLGPLAVAALTEHLFASPQGIGHAMAVVAAVALPASAALAFVAARRERVMNRVVSVI